MKPEVMDLDDFSAPDLRDYGRTLWRHRKMIALAVIVAVGLAAALSLVQSPVYEATADLIIQPSGSLQLGTASSQDAQNAPRDVANETAVLESQPILDAATKKLGHIPKVSISSKDTTSDVVSITARSSNKVRAAGDANVYAKTYVVVRRQQSVDTLDRAAVRIQSSIDGIDAQIATLDRGSAALASAQRQRVLLEQQLDQVKVAAELNEVGGARVLASAKAPTSPISPKPKRNVAIALVLGLLLGIALSFVREFLDDKITTREDLERATGGLPVLGQIPRVDHWRRATNQLVTQDPVAGEEAASEAYRTLRTAIQFLGVDRALRTIQITSPESAEGKTLTVANLAVAFARAGHQVALVCCDLRRPRVHELFGLPNTVGFTSVLLGEMPVMTALQVVDGEPNLAVLSSGPLAPNPSELLGSSRAQKAIITLAEEADLVLIDSPPVLPVTDALIVSGIANATIIVASAGSTTRRSMARALDLLHQVDAPLVGSVLNNAEPLSATGYAPYSTNGTGANGTNGNGSYTRTRRIPTRPSRSR
jgi:polysaccharide biosynthesis transport protein